ncbi:MAG: insulinase family protein [Oligoflexia bacterium]|nr:insulinase family protein [Oligoflexia bacterium]
MPKNFQPEELTLSNGIPLILQHYESPVAATYWWVKTGSADEGKGEEGFAHFLEHMLFKDAAAKETGRASTGQTARAIESLGGDINAYTSFDQTVYHVTCAAHHWERVIDVFGLMAKPQRFLKDDFEREREVILEELRKNEDSPGRQLFQNLFTQTFRKHPYGRPVIGYAKTLKAAKVGQLEAFYKRNYVSAKMGLVLVGPVQDATGARKKAIIRALEKRFGQGVIPRRVATVRPRPAEPELRKGTPPVLVKGFDVKTPTVSFSFRAPELLHSDIPALDLLAGILGMGELGRLYQQLFYKTSIATEVSGSLFVPKDPGMLYFEAEVPDVSKVNAAAEEIFKEMRRLRDEGPTEQELARVIVNIESERLYATQTADGLAGRLGFLKYILGNMEFDRAYLEELHLVDAARIREVVAKYLVPERMSSVVLVPKNESTFEGGEIAAAAARILGSAELVRSATPRKTARGAAKGGLGAETFTLPSGIKVVHFERPQSHVFSVHASVLGGLRLELAHPVESAALDWGASHLLANTFNKGTRGFDGQGGKDSRAIASIIEGHASGLEGFSGRNSVGVQLTGLTRDWGTLSALLSEVLLTASFPDTEVDHSRRVVEDQIRGIEDHSSQLCSKLFLEALFEKHPYGKLTTGSLESIQAIGSAKLARFHQAWLRPERLVLSVSGAIRRPMLDQWLAEIDARAAAIGRERPPVELPVTLADEPALKGPRWVEKSLGREQVHILVGGLGTRIFAEDRFALRLLQTLLGGQSGRLFIELREKKSLAYTVAPVSFEGLERGYVGTYIACAPQKKDEAIAGIRAVLEKLVEKGPTPAEMARAKEYLLGRRAMDLQSDSALASHYGLEALYGIPPLDEAALIRKINSLTARAVRDVCRDYLVTPHQVTAVVG